MEIRKNFVLLFLMTILQFKVLFLCMLAFVRDVGLRYAMQNFGYAFVFAVHVPEVEF